ncbi:hypothetical protein JB92DRAFT_2954397 [Gautieria morchelliformis]|nr:hypothetical protein JB92DRAFT_2954397 [Gautieria morchelliformis]
MRGGRAWALVHPSRPTPHWLVLSSHRVVPFSHPLQHHILGSGDTHRHHLTPLNSKGLHKHGDIKTGGRAAAFDAVELDTRTGRKDWKVWVRASTALLAVDACEVARKGRTPECHATPHPT